MERSQLIDFLGQKYPGRDVTIKLYTKAHSLNYYAHWLQFKNRHVIKCMESGDNPELIFRVDYKGTNADYSLVKSPT